MRSLAFYILVMLMAACLAGSARAEENNDQGGWKTSLLVDVTATQTAYSDSWVGGEAGAASWVGNLSGSLERQLLTWFDLKSTLKLSFGQTLSQDTANHWRKPRKSTDLIDWENVGRFTTKGYVDPFVAFRLESQFVDASVETLKRYLSPIKLTESAGIARKFYERDADHVTSRLGIATRQIIKSVIIAGIQNGDTVLFTEDSVLSDGGIESVSDAKFSFGDKLNYEGKLTLYKALIFSGRNRVAGTEFEDDWKAVDVNWENIIKASVSRIVTVNLYVQFLYDKEVSRRGRLKQTLGVGFVFKLI